MLNPAVYRGYTQPTPELQMTDARLKEFMDKWSKAPGFADFEVNDFLSCVKDIFAEEMKARQISVYQGGGHEEVMGVLEDLEGVTHNTPIYL